MYFNVDLFTDFLWTFALLAAGWLVGWVLEAYFLRRIPRVNSLYRTLSGLGRWMGFAAGLGLALRYQLLPEGWESDAVTFWKMSSIFIATIFLARLVGRYVHEHTMGIEGDLPSTSLVQNLVSGLVYLVGILIILQTLGISVTPVLTALGVGGLAVALALQDTLGNLFAGIQIIASRKILVGQFIALENGQDGYVTDITWRYTTIHTLTNQLVIIPNSKLASSIVVNAHLPSQDISTRVEVGVHYDSDLERVERIALETAHEVLSDYPGTQPDVEPVIRFREFGESSINMAIVVRVKEWTDQFALRHLLIKALHKRFREEQIVIPYPMRTLTLEGGFPVEMKKKVPQNNN